MPQHHLVRRVGAGILDLLPRRSQTKSHRQMMNSITGHCWRCKFWSETRGMGAWAGAAHLTDPVAHFRAVTRDMLRLTAAVLCCLAGYTAVSGCTLSGCYVSMSGGSFSRKLCAHGATAAILYPHVVVMKRLVRSAACPARNTAQWLSNLRSHRDGVGEAHQYLSIEQTSDFHVRNRSAGVNARVRPGSQYWRHVGHGIRLRVHCYRIVIASGRHLAPGVRGVQLCHRRCQHPRRWHHNHLWHRRVRRCIRYRVSISCSVPGNVRFMLHIHGVLVHLVDSQLHQLACGRACLFVLVLGSTILFIPVF